jgi:hypothetical protein
LEDAMPIDSAKTKVIQTISKWMQDDLEEKGYLYQKSAAYRIKQEFGEEYVYKNKNKNWAINKEILKHFEKATKKDVVWDKKSRRWRKREQDDKPGRQQKK